MNNAVLLILCGLPLVVLVHQSRRLDIAEQRLRAISRIDSKINLLLKHAGIEYNPYSDLPPNVMDALKRGKKIEAKKIYRNATKVSLKEVKEFIEQVQRVTGTWFVV
jgi:ribosomal protein L7/L12